ncbi:MAG: tetratricopeptide repeat protein [Succinivibrio sp.]
MLKKFLFLMLASSVATNALAIDEQSYKKACLNGKIEACSALGLAYARGDDLEQNYDEAKYYLEMSCSKGFVPGCFNLGNMYEKGLGVPKDYKMAYSYFEKACDEQNPWGYARIARMYEKGMGVDKDESKAKEFYHKACSLGLGQVCSKAQDTENK